MSALLVVKELSISNIFQTLPNELLEAIFVYRESSEDLKLLCLVNKEFYAVAKNLLWKEPKLKPFTLEDFKWIHKMPIQVLDLGRWIPLSKSSLVELFEMIGQMERLNHLKLMVSPSECIRHYVLC